MGKTVTSRFVLKGDNQLNTAFSKAQKQLGDIAKKAALFSTAAIVGGAAIVKSQAAAIDSLAKTADVVGVGIEALQGYRLAAEKAGIANVGIDDSLRRLSRRAGEFANSGAGPAAKAFDQLGISIRGAGGAVKGTEQLFDEIIVAMKGVETDSQRAALAAQLFGDDFGPKLVPLINQGVAGIRASREELRQLGALISDTDAAGVERMNDAMALAQIAIKGAAQAFTVALAPAIAAIAEEFTDAIKESDGFTKEIVDAAESTGIAIASVANVVAALGRSFTITSRLGIIALESLKAGVVGLGDSIINSPNRAFNLLLQQFDRIPGIDVDYRFPELAPSLVEQIRLSEGIIKAAMEDISDIAFRQLPLSKFEEAIAGVRKKMAAFQRDVSGGADVDIDTGFIGPPSDEADKRRNALQREYAALISSTRTAQEAHTAQITRIGELFTAGAIPSAEEYSDVIVRINEKFAESEVKIEELGQFAIQAARSMQTAFADFLFDPFDQGLKGMLKGFANTMRRMVSEAASASLLKSIFGGSGVAGILGGILGAASKKRRPPSSAGEARIV